MEKKEIIISENRSFEGVWIPKKLYITNKFNLRTKFFIVEVKSLSKNGYCFATDKHFSDFLGISERMVQTIIKQLKDDKYLTAEYKYKEGTNSIERRYLILTKKFLDEFYNEKEAEPIEKNFNTPTEINCEEPIEENCNGGTEKNYGEKYNNNIKSNNDLSITDSSNTDAKVDTLSNDNGEVYTSSPKKSLPIKKRKRTKSELKKLEEDMVKRFYNIARQYDISDIAYQNVCNAFKRYLSKYTEKTGKVHPILKDETLEKVFTTLATISDTQYGHFENVAEYEPDENGLSCLDEIVDEFFKIEHGEDTDYHITHFANSEYLEKLANHVVEW